MTEAPAWYGKLAALGDFAHRRLPAAWSGRVEDWLSLGMQAGQAAAGERWLACYLSAPWRAWAWAPGVVDDQWWFGVLMPSCDAVGRYFPLLAGQARPRPPQDRIALDHLELWIAYLAQAVLATLQGLPVDDFDAALREAPPWPTAGRPPARPLAEEGRWVGEDHVGPAEWAHALAAAALQQRLHGHSVWWGDDGRLQLVRGLPAGEDFVRLFDGSG